MLSTGMKIGAGAYGSVEEVAVLVTAAAKKIHDILQDRSEVPAEEICGAKAQFVRESYEKALRQTQIYRYAESYCRVKSV